ncbi:MAG: hypothetical protein ACLPKI_22220 [Streptosporangiaceae bacterium]
MTHTNVEKRNGKSRRQVKLENAEKRAAENQDQDQDDDHDGPLPMVQPGQ